MNFFTSVLRQKPSQIESEHEREVDFFALSPFSFYLVKTPLNTNDSTPAICDFAVFVRISHFFLSPTIFLVWKYVATLFYNTRSLSLLHMVFFISKHFFQLFEPDFDKFSSQGLKGQMLMKNTKCIYISNCLIYFPVLQYIIYQN